MGRNIRESNFRGRYGAAVIAGRAAPGVELIPVRNRADAVDRGVLALSAETGKKGEVSYVRGPAFGDLVALRERLALVRSAR